MNYFNTYKGLPKSIYILFLAQVINRFGDFVLPFLTLLLVKKLGLSFETAGFAVMLATLSTIPGAFAGGKMADHYGRKKTYGLFQGSAAVLLLSCAFTNNPYAIIVLVCAAAFFNGGVRPCLSAIITDVLPAEKRQLGFSLSYLGINLGVALGPMMAGFLFNHNFKLIFIGDAITSLLAVTLMMTQIKETLPKTQQMGAVDQSHSEDRSSSEDPENMKVASATKTEDSERAVDSERAEEGNVFNVLFRRPQVLLFLIINTLISAVYTQHSFSLPLMAEHVFGATGPQLFGYIMSFNAITVLVMTTVVTHHSHKNHPLVNIGFAALTYAIGFGMIGFIHSLWLFFASAFLWTLGEILIVTNFNVYIANNTPQNFRARFNAVTSLSWSIGSALGTYGVGKYMDAFGITAVWPLTMVVATIAAVSIFGLRFLGKAQN